MPLDVLLQVQLELSSHGCRARAHGSVRLGDVVCTPARGRFWITAGSLRVRIWFRDRDGTRHRLDGRVRVDRSSPMWSVSRLRGLLWREHRLIGRIELRFDLRRGLPRLLRGVRLVPRSGQSEAF